jgi:chromosome segregation ATPase
MSGGFGDAEQLIVEEMAFGQGASEEKTSTRSSNRPLVVPETAMTVQSHAGQAAISIREQPGKSDAAPELTELANSLAHAIVTAVHGFQKAKTDEASALRASLLEREKDLDATVEELIDAKRKIQSLTGSVSEQEQLILTTQRNYAELEAAVSSLQKGHDGHEAGLRILDDQTKALSGSLTERLDAVLGRLDLQQQELSTVKGGLSDRLDRQADTIRSIRDGQEQRGVALDRVIESLTQLKASSASTPAGSEAL